MKVTSGVYVDSFHKVWDIVDNAGNVLGSIRSIRHIERGKGGDIIGYTVKKGGKTRQFDRPDHNDCAHCTRKAAWSWALNKAS